MRGAQRFRSFFDLSSSTPRPLCAVSDSGRRIVNTVASNSDLIRVLLSDPVKAPSIDLFAALFSDLMLQIYKGFSEKPYAISIPKI